MHLGVKFFRLQHLPIKFPLKIHIFSLRGPVALENNVIGLQYFKIIMTIEEIKFAYFYSEIYEIPCLQPHHVRESYGQ